MRHMIFGILLPLTLFTSLPIPLAAYPASLDEDLCAAAEAGKTADVADLLAKGGKVDAKCTDGETPLMLAAGEGHLETVRLLISKGAKVNELRKGSTALAEAAGEGHPDVVQVLLDAHADLNAIPGNFSPLVSAARSGPIETVKLLLAHGAKIDEGLQSGWSALFYAAQGRGVEMVRFLLAEGANVNSKDPLGQTALMVAATSIGGTEIVPVLLEKGADPNARTHEGKTALMMAARKGEAETVRLLLDKGADPNARDNDGKTALMLASNAATRELLSKAPASGGSEVASKQEPASAPKNANVNPSPGASLSLGELARQQREQRKSQAPPKMVFTNDGAIPAPGQNPKRALNSTPQSTAGAQEAAGSTANIPATPTLTVNGWQAKLTQVIAVPDLTCKDCISVFLSDVPVSEEDAHSSALLAQKASWGQVHAAQITFDAAGQAIGFAVYHPAFPGGLVSGGGGQLPAENLRWPNRGGNSHHSEHRYGGKQLAVGGNVYGADRAPAGSPCPSRINANGQQTGGQGSDGISCCVLRQRHRADEVVHDPGIREQA